MNLSLLFVDELRGFYKSKVMIFLWVGLPIITTVSVHTVRRHRTSYFLHSNLGAGYFQHSGNSRVGDASGFIN